MKKVHKRYFQLKTFFSFVNNFVRKNAADKLKATRHGTFQKKGIRRFFTQFHIAAVFGFLAHISQSRFTMFTLTCSICQEGCFPSKQVVH